MKIGLKKKYGVVKYRGTAKHNSCHELMFQSDEAFEAMKELERLSDIEDHEHGYTLILNEDKPTESG